MNGVKINRGKYAAWSASLLAVGSLAFSPILFPAMAAQLRSNIVPVVNTFTPAGVDSLLAKKFAAQIETRAISGTDKRFPFTPTGLGANRNRTITVAARTDASLSAGAVSVRNVLGGFDAGLGKTVRLRQSDYRLTSARGWQGFALPIAQPAAQKIASPLPLGNLTTHNNFHLDDTNPGKPSRFSTSVKLDPARETAPSPRGNAASGEYRLDVGGSFSISRKIDVTAGVRYNSERDRLIPQPDNSRDSEAVYVGTKVRF